MRLGARKHCLSTWDPLNFVITLGSSYDFSHLHIFREVLKEGYRVVEFNLKSDSIKVMTSFVPHPSFCSISQEPLKSTMG